MQCSRCGLCCCKTEMMLSNTDVELLESKDHGKKPFFYLDKQGYAKLRNRNGCCVFFEADKNACLVYADRPRGCRAYPIVYSEEKSITVDRLCPLKTTVTKIEIAEKGREVLQLLRTIDREAKERTLVCKSSSAYGHVSGTNLNRETTRSKFEAKMVSKKTKGKKKKPQKK